MSNIFAYLLRQGSFTTYLHRMTRWQWVWVIIGILSIVYDIMDSRYGFALLALVLWVVVITIDYRMFRKLSQPDSIEL